MTVGSWIKRRRQSLQFAKAEDKTDGGATTTSSSDSEDNHNNNNNSNHDVEVSERSSDDSLPSSTNSSTRSNNSKLSALSPANQSFVERFTIDSDDDDDISDDEDDVDSDEEPRGLFEIDLDYDVVEIQEEKSTKKKLPKRTSTSAQIVSFFETFRDGEIEEIVFE